MIDWSKAESVAARREAQRLAKAARIAEKSMQEATDAYMEALEDNRNAAAIRAILDHRKAVRAWAKDPVGDPPKRGA